MYLKIGCAEAPQRSTRVLFLALLVTCGACPARLPEATGSAVVQVDLPITVDPIEYRIVATLVPANHRDVYDTWVFGSGTLEPTDTLAPTDTAEPAPGWRMWNASSGEPGPFEDGSSTIDFYGLGKICPHPFAGEDFFPGEDAPCRVETRLRIQAETDPGSAMVRLVVQARACKPPDNRNQDPPTLTIGPIEAVDDGT